MSVTLSKSFGFKKRVQDSGSDAELHDVDGQYEVIKMDWVGKKGHDKHIGSWDWHEHHLSYSADEARANLDTFWHNIHLYADSHGHPEFPTEHVHTHATKRIDLDKEDLEGRLREADGFLYFQAHYKVGIQWHKHHMKLEVKNPKTHAVMATKDIPYHQD